MLLFVVRMMYAYLTEFNCKTEEPIMKSISIIAVALVYMMCFLYGCTRELSRTDPIGEKIEQLEKVSQNDGEGVLAFAIKDSIGHLTN